MYLIPGVLGYIACCLFDINKIRWQSQKLNLLFIIGVILLFYSTACCIVYGDAPMFPANWNMKHILSLIGLILSGLGEIYVLFFALPFESTYVESESIPLIDKGVYALCRHPGFWTLALFYLFLWTYFSTIQMLEGFILYTICNFIYIYIQDRYIFPEYIQGYDNYKESVPFLIPNMDSIRKAFRH